MYYSWLSSHVIDRFADGLPVAQYYAHTAGYKISSVSFTLTIPKLNCESSVMQTIKGLKIHVIETGVQLLKPDDKPLWYETVRSNILSVINSTQVNTRDPPISNNSSCSLLVHNSGFSQSALPVEMEEGIGGDKVAAF